MREILSTPGAANGSGRPGLTKRGREPEVAPGVAHRRRTLAAVMAGGLCAAGALAMVPMPASAAVRRLSVSSVPPAAPASTPAPAASTCSPARLAALQAVVEAQLTGRVTQLTGLTAAVSGSGTLSTGDKATLSTDLANEQSGIAALQSKGQGEATCALVNQDARAMVLDYRVYVVMTPQVHLTISADTETALVAQVTAIEPPLQAAIAAAQAQGKDVSAAQAAFTDLQAQVATASKDSAGISATVLAFTPASYPACWSTFVSERGSLTTGAQALRAADRDAHAIVNDLK
jgi:hypothetical protein